MIPSGKPVRRIFLKTGGWTIFFYLLVFIPINVVEQAQLAFGSRNIHIYRDYPHSIYANTADFAAHLSSIYLQQKNIPFAKKYAAIAQQAAYQVHIMYTR